MPRALERRGAELGLSLPWLAVRHRRLPAGRPRRAQPRAARAARAPPPPPLTVARVLAHFVEPPRACSYLTERTASLEYRMMAGVSAAELERMLVRGWRRQGAVYFRPACAGCAECVSIRIPVDR